MKSAKKVFTLRLSNEVFEQTKDASEKENRSISNFIEYALIKYFQNSESKKQ